MFHSAKSKMPALDYVSIVSSLFADRFALSVGTLAAALTSAVIAFSINAPILYVFSVLLVMLAVWRYWQATAFLAQELSHDDVAGAEKWENRATVSGSAAAIVFGMWCFVSLVVVQHEFAVLGSLLVTMAAMVGIVARNYGLDRLVTLQLFLFGVPICLGLVFDGNGFHVFLAAMFVPMMLSYRALASDVRSVLLAAVRDRVEVTRLADELDTALMTMSHGLLMLDEQMNIVVANEQMQVMLCGQEELNCLDSDFSDFTRRIVAHGQLSQLAAQRLASAVANAGESKLVLQLLDGRHCEFSINRNQKQTVLVVEDITERMQSENRIRFMARFDPATNLPNRAFFSEQVRQRLQMIQQSGRAQDVAMLVVDIDDFKNINDTYGHPIGDRVLTMIARRLRQSLDSSVMVGRFGGDEFVAFFEKCTSRDETEFVVDALLESLREPFLLDEQNFEIHASAGLVVNNSDDCDLEKLLKRADLALYSAKGNGKGAVSMFSADMCRANREKQVIKAALRQAVENEELQLAFQPVMDLESRTIVGCEALARWHHPELGNIPPDVFILLAEEMGIISQITDWALHRAAKECSTWLNDIGVAVNISARDFKGRNVQEMVYSALRQSGISSDRLEIEVTETVLVKELETASEALGELASRGVGIALDDFGTGYSSLGYLHDLPFTKLKVDRTFTMDVTSDPKAKKLMRNIAVLGRDLNMKVTVEGVETHEQLEVVSDIGLVDSVQGYLFGAPVPQSEIASLIVLLSGGRTADNSYVDEIKTSA